MSPVSVGDSASYRMITSLSSSFRCCICVKGSKYQHSKHINTNTSTTISYVTSPPPLFALYMRSNRIVKHQSGTELPFKGNFLLIHHNNIWLSNYMLLTCPSRELASSILKTVMPLMIISNEMSLPLPSPRPEEKH